MVDGGGLENHWVHSPGGSNPSLSDFLKYTQKWRGARVAEGGCLLSNCAVMVPRVRIPPSPNQVIPVQDIPLKERLFQNSDSNEFAAYAYMPLIGWLIPLYQKMDDAFCLHHAKQGFILAGFCVILSIILNIINIFIPNEWMDVRYSLIILIYVVYILYPITCFISALLTLKGKKFNFPIIKRLADLIEL